MTIRGWEKSVEGGGYDVSADGWNWPSFVMREPLICPSRTIALSSSSPPPYFRNCDKCFFCDLPLFFHLKIQPGPDDLNFAPFCSLYSSPSLHTKKLDYYYFFLLLSHLGCTNGPPLQLMGRFWDSSDQKTAESNILSKWRQTESCVHRDEGWLTALIKAALILKLQRHRGHYASPFKYQLYGETTGAVTLTKILPVSRLQFR